MDRPQDIEAWADQVLDQHRTGPPAARGGGLDSLDDWWEEKRERAQRRHAAWSNLEGIVMLIGSVLALALLFSVLSTF